ncbi:MAG TPA: AarF/ABC1/UbiB kinase family protein [Candidatus Bathyarchaeota archaeon]|nr:AarF/ABC1/UbiB kinase family protein [Candidatus Bathyarchaeota archaeon]
MVNRLKRYAQIAGILSKYGFGIFLEELYPEDKRPDFLKDADVESQDIYRRIRLAIEELGPTFIKLGQILSGRRDLLPVALIEELLFLTDDVKPVDYSEVKTVIEETCGEVGEFCIFVDPEPFAAASLSQVHRATLMDGSDVVFKIQRPGIRELIEVDLTILANLAQRAEESIPYLRPYNPVGVIEEFSQQMRKELDFVRDGKNAEIIANNLKNMTSVKIPKVYWEYTGPRLLVMEYVEGVRIDNVEVLKETHDLKELANIGFEAYIQQIFTDGFYHGDPHPGNIRVTDDGKIVFFDFGLVGVLRPERRHAYTRVIYGLVTSDIDLLLDSFEELDIEIASEDIDGLKDEMYAALKETENYSIEDYSFQESMNQLNSTLYRYHIRMPGNLMLMIKVITMVGDIGFTLDPEFNFMQKIQPYIGNLMRQSLFSQESLEQTRNNITREILRFPKALRKFLENISSGQSRMEVTVPEVAEINKSLENTGWKMFLGLLSMGLIIGLSIIISTTNILTQDLITLVTLLGGVALLIIILKGITSGSD